MQVLVIHPVLRVSAHLQPLIHRYHATGFHARSLSEACSLLEKIHPQLVIAARSLLAEDARALFDALRQPEPPILFLTNIRTVEDLSGPEQTRIEAMLAYLGRHSTAGAAPLQVGDLRIDPAQQCAGVGGQWVSLPPLQFRLLSYLAEHAGEVVHHQELLRAVWGYDGNQKEARTLLKVHVRQLRRRLGLMARTGEYLRSIRGVGYILEAPAP